LSLTTSRTAKIAAAVSAGLACLALAGPAVASQAAAQHASHSPAARGGLKSFQVKQILFGSKLSHSFLPAGSSVRKTEPLAGPDDITALGRNLFTGFQNGVGAQGEPSTSGNTDCTIVEFTGSGKVIRQWDIKGKCDGVTADPGIRAVIVTVNEDAKSSLYTITPGARASRQVVHYRYNKPLPHFGGTDAISIYRGQVFISASAPGTSGGKPAPQPTYPAVYRVGLDPFTHVAAISPVFRDGSKARVANYGRSFGKVVTLALTDPDSNSVVPRSALRFAGDFMLTSQGDNEQIFLQSLPRHATRLELLRLSNSVDDTAWATSASGHMYATDSSANTVDVVTGRFPVGIAFTAVTPCNANSAPATCPAPGFPPNFLGAINPFTGHLTAVPVTGAPFQPKGLIYVAPGGRVS
jgi:hypothetical protein